MMRPNAAGLIVSGPNNPNWKGGSISKTCEVCARAYTVKRPQAASRFCSMKCVGASQRGIASKASTMVEKECPICGADFLVYPSHIARRRFCSKACSGKHRSANNVGPANVNWAGGLSRLPYPWNFKSISKDIIERDGGRCHGIECAGTDTRMTAHHINYDKQDCSPTNLIALCSACNSKANFGRPRWQAAYERLMAGRLSELAA